MAETTTSLIFQLVLAIEELNGVEAAYERITRQLVPEDATGYGPAHLWIATSIIDGELKPPVEQARHMNSWAICSLPPSIGN